MTELDRVEAVRQFGYTRAEAEFVTIAALHSGYFLRRQYYSKHGGMPLSLCQKVVALEHADYAKYDNAQVYHLYGKSLYEALGESDNRHRRARDPFAVRAKLMGLDYVLAHPESRFLPTEAEKLSYFCDVRGFPLGSLPTKVYTGQRGRKTERYFVDKFPIKLDPETEKVSICYINEGTGTGPGFPSWLLQYAPLLGELGTAEVVYVANVAGYFAQGAKEFAQRFPQQSGAINPDLLRYFEARQKGEQDGFIGRTQAELNEYRTLARRYSEDRFEVLWRAWTKAETPPANGPGITFSTYLLPHDYRVAGTVGVTK